MTVHRWMTETDPWPKRHSVMKEVVLAVDYDAVAARLAKAMEAIALTEGALADVKRLQWLVLNGECFFGSVWRDASMKDIDAVMSATDSADGRETGVKT
jgi:hypothetical protein